MTNTSTVNLKSLWVLLLFAITPFLLVAKSIAKEPHQTFNCPPFVDLVLNCSDDIPNSIDAWLTSGNELFINSLPNGNTEYSVSNDYEGTPPAAVCNIADGGRLVTFTASHINGDIQRCAATIFIQDDQLVIPICPIDNLVLSSTDNIGQAITVWLTNSSSALLVAATNAKGCDGEGDIAISNDYNGITPIKVCNQADGGVLVTFTAADECGNTATCQGSIIILENQAPLLDCFHLADITLACNEDLSSSNTGTPLILIEDSSNPSPSSATLTFVDDNTNLNNCTGTILRTWTADVCGFTSTCVQVITIIPAIGESIPCPDIQIQSIDNQLTLSNISAPNTITKVFDANWLLVSNCSGDCPETVTIPDLVAGDIYHTDIQLYDENWNFICEDKQDIEIIGGDNEPCDTSICQGNVVLRNQAAVDAFCGCAVIEGNLRIGSTDNSDTNDIYSLENLSAIKTVKGHGGIIGTQLINLKGLENLERVGGTFNIGYNAVLNTLEGLEGLKHVTNSFALSANPQLRKIDALKSLNHVGLTISIFKNPMLENVEGFSNVQNKAFVSLNITGNHSLKTLKGLEGLERLVGVEFQGLTIQDNANLEDISALNSIRIINGKCTIRFNPQLACCSLAHLLDFDNDNGIVEGRITLLSNSEFCNTREAIAQNCIIEPPLACENIQIQSTDNQLTLSNISAPNTITKVFDANWQLVSNCSGDCPETVTIPNLVAGEIYHTEIQMYDENWSFICEDKQDIEIVGGSEPCDTSICQGDVVLRTQTEVDAFCGCEVIEGNLIMIGEGVLDDVVGLASDISDIDIFSNLKEVKGNLVIVNTSISHLSPFKNLNQIGGVLVVNYNSALTRLEGLDFVETVGEGLVIENNPLLENLDDLRSLKSYNSLSIAGNLTSISHLKEIPVNKLRSLSIVNCELLESLDGLNNIDSIFREESGFISVTIASNSKLKNLNALSNLSFLDGELNIVANDELTNCCSIAHLIDTNTNNGSVAGAIRIENNPQFCNSPEEILQACQTPPPLCENIEIITQNNQIVIEGLTAPNEIVKVFDKDYNIVYQCVANCADQQMAGTFPLGQYVVDLQLYDENWGLICSEQRTVNLENTNPCNITDCETTPPVLSAVPADMTVSCDAEYNDFTNVIATDNCDTDVQIDYEEIRTNGDCGDNYVITRIWTAIDDCGNSSEAQQVIHVQDYIAPVLANIPADETVECDAIPSEPINITATDNCDNDVAINFSEEFVEGNCQNNFSLIRTWKATDNCGNTATSVQVIVVEDTTPPVLTDIPADLTINPADDIPLRYPIVSDLCTLSPDISIELEDVINDTETEIVRTFTATDNCGNTTTAQQIITIIQDENNLCDAIIISTADGEITFSNIDAPNAIVKVFDANYKIIFECTASCESTLVVPVVGAGVYHTDVQFYDENWGFICKDRQDIELMNGGEPCDTSVCQGDVVLRTQADVDAFCGCEVIEGELDIGTQFVDINNRDTSDIHDLSNLLGLKEVKGTLIIKQTRLKNLKGLDALERIGIHLGLRLNRELTTVAGLEKLQVTSNVSISYNDKLAHLDNFESLRDIGDYLIISNNPILKSIAGFSSMQTTTLKTLRISSNEALANLDGLESLQSIIKSGVSGNLSVSGNNSLTNINSLRNIQLVENGLSIFNNPELSECCGIAQLLDFNLDNGQVFGNVRIQDNLSFCSSRSSIQDNCQPPSNCLTLKPDGTTGKDNEVWSNGADYVSNSSESLIPYTWTNSGRLGIKRVFLAFDFSSIPNNAVITEASLSLFYNPMQIAESFDVHTGENDLYIQRVLSNWEADMLTWNTQPATTNTNQVALPPSISGTQDYLDIDVTNLVSDIRTEAAGNHGFMIRLADELNYYKSAVFASSNHPNPALHPEITICWEMVEVSPFDCSDNMISIVENGLSISNLTAPIEIVKVFDNNYSTVYECFADCAEDIHLADLTAGTYHISINAYDENWQPICETIDTVVIENNAQDRNIDFLPADFALFPNPATTEAFIDLSKLKGEKVELELFNQFGQQVSQQVIEKVTEQKAVIDLSATQNGLYILKIKAKNRRAIAKKLLVNRLY